MKNNLFTFLHLALCLGFSLSMIDEVHAKHEERKVIKSRVLDQQVELNKTRKKRNSGNQTTTCKVTDFTDFAAVIGTYWKQPDQNACPSCTMYFPEMANQMLAFDGTAEAYVRPEARGSGVEVTLSTATNVKYIRLYPGGESTASDPARMTVEGWDGKGFTLIFEGDVQLPTQRNTNTLYHYVDVILNNSKSYSSYKIIFPEVNGGFDASACTTEEGGSQGCRMYKMVIAEIELFSCANR